MFTKTVLAGLLLLSIGFPQVAFGDIVTDWNQTTLMLNPSHGTQMGGRTLAMVHTAIYDTLMAFDGTYDPYYVMAGGILQRG